MPAYVIADIEITDAAGYEEYRRRVPATVAQYGGRYLVRGGAAETLEGDWQPRRLVVLEFPSIAQARRWYDSRGVPGAPGDPPALLPRPRHPGGRGIGRCAGRTSPSPGTGSSPR